MLERIWAFITRRQLVWLKDHDGEVTLSIMDGPDAWGETRAKRMWPFNIHNVTLLPDGTVDGGYVKFWKPYNT